MFRIMYSDVGYRQRVNSWDAVDVMRPDGLLQHGTITDVAPDGLIVDYGCTGQRGQMVRYGEAFGYSADFIPGSPLFPGSAVMALLRDNPRCPWIWRPGTLVIKDNGMLALVDVQLDGIMRREIVHVKQVRPPQSPADMQSRAIEQAAFTVTAVNPLPNAIIDLLPTHSPRWKIFCQELSRYASPTLVSINELRLLHPALKSQSELVHDESAESAHCSLQNLPHLVMWEIFTYLDTIDRVSYRRVCHLFDDLISESLSTEIRLTYHECSLGKLTNCYSCRRQLVVDYLTRALVLKHVTPRTRCITLTNVGHSNLLDVLLALGICGQLRQRDAGQEVLVVARQCDLDREIECLWENADALAEAMAGAWCTKLLLTQRTTRCGTADFRSSGSMRSFRFIGSLEATKADLWRMVEGQVPAFDIQRMTDLVVQAVLNHSPVVLREISSVLEKCASPDPRPFNVYAGFCWTEDDVVNLDVFKLSRLAQYALSRLLPPEVVDSFPS